MGPLFRFVPHFGGHINVEAEELEWGQKCLFISTVSPLSSSAHHKGFFV